MLSDQEISQNIIEAPRKLALEELYQHMHKQYKAARFEIGQLQSEIDEMRYERDRLQKMFDQLKAADKETIQEVQREKMYQVITEHNKKLEKRIAGLRKSNEELIIKLNILNKKPPPETPGP